MKYLFAITVLLGALIMLAGGILAWLAVVAAAAQVHWLLGLSVFIGTFWFGHKRQDILFAPWALWTKFCEYLYGIDFDGDG